MNAPPPSGDEWNRYGEAAKTGASFLALFLGLWAFVRWPLFLLLKRVMRAVLADDEVQLQLGRVMRERILKTEFDELHTACEAVEDLARMREDVRAILGFVAEHREAINDHRDWLRDITAAVNTTLNVPDRRSDIDRRVPAGLPLLPPIEEELRRRIRRKDD